MHRFLARFTLLLCLFSSLHSIAQTVSIGEGLYLGTEYEGSLPINPYSGYTYSETIYLAKDIEASGNITAINYHFHGATLANSRVVRIYMEHTTESKYATVNSWISSTNLVFAGKLDSVFGDTILRIPLTTPFAYNGTDNLVIGVDENDPNYDGENDKFYYSKVPVGLGYRSLVFVADDYDVSPTRGLPSGDGLYEYANIKIEGLKWLCRRPDTPSVFGLTRTSAKASWRPPTAGPMPSTWV